MVAYSASVFTSIDFTSASKKSLLIDFNNLTDQYLADGVNTNSFRLELFNLVLTHRIASLPFSEPPRVRDFDSTYDRWLRLEEHFQGKVSLLAQVNISGYPLIESRLLNYGKVWKNNLSEDFNVSGKRLQIGKDQTVELIVSESGYAGIAEDRLELFCNYVLYRDIITAPLTRSLNSQKVEVTNNSLHILNKISLYSLDLKNDGTEPVEIAFKPSLDPADFFNLMPGESFTFNSGEAIISNCSVVVQCSSPEKSSIISLTWVT